MTTYPPIVLPPADNPGWGRASQIVAALRANGKQNPFIVAAIVDSYAEAAWRPVITGDRGQSFGPWQMKWVYYGLPAFDALQIDIRSETDLAKHVAVLLWALALPANAAVSAALDLATTGADATRLFAGGFERASAGGAVDRRVAIAPQIEVWLATEAT